MGSTEVATRPVSHPAFASREEMQAMVEHRREMGQMARAFRAATWGKDLDEATARSMAEWCKRHRIDPTEVSILGGNPYIEASYYLRRLTELDSDLIEYAFADHVHLDQRLVTQMNEPVPDDADDETRSMIHAMRRESRLEHYRRIAERVAHNLPDTAPAAVVYRVKRRGMEREYVGSDWCGGKGTKTMKRKDGGTYQKEIDPVGDAEPRKTAETRAARRCLRQVISTFPSLASEMEQIELEAKNQIAPAIERDRLAIASQVPRGTPQLVSDDTIPVGEHETLVPSPGQAAAPAEAEANPSEDEVRDAGPVVKAQRWQLQQLLLDGSWTEDEKTAALAVADQSTYGEFARFLAEMRLELVERQRDDQRPPTAKQVELFQKMMRSHLWSEEEKVEAATFLETATFSMIGRRLDRIDDELRDRRHAESAEKRRIAEGNDVAA
jgi:hypothetical protein